MSLSEDAQVAKPNNRQMKRSKKRSPLLKCEKCGLPFIASTTKRCQCKVTKPNA